jgi:hypothetical protein
MKWKPDIPSIDTGQSLYIIRCNQAHEAYQALGIHKEEINRGQAWEHYAEAMFDIVRRMADARYAQATSWAQMGEMIAAGRSHRDMLLRNLLLRKLRVRKGVSDEQTTTISFRRFCPWEQIQRRVDKHCSPGRSVRLLNAVTPRSPGRPAFSDPGAHGSRRCDQYLAGW